MSDPHCRRCGSRLRTGLVATGLTHCCLSPGGIAGVCPEHGPVAPCDAVAGPEH